MSLDPGSRLPARSLLPVLVVVLGVTVLAVLTAHLDFVSDDAFISFRYARNLSRGDGLVFNPGERVEGYTNFLVVVVLAVLHRAGADLVVAGRALSAAGGAAAVVLTYLLARRTAPAGSRLVSPVAVSVLAVNPYLGAWAGSGLETTVFAALLVATLLPLAGAQLTARRFSAASGFALLLALTRPEGVALYAVVAAWAALAAPGRGLARLRTLAPGLALFTAVGGTYFGWRWWYFDAFLPNTFHVKGAFTLGHVQRGLEYLGTFGANPFVLFALPLAVAGLAAALRRRELLIPAVLVASLCITVAEGGDGLPMYRFLVPALPLLAVLVGIGVASLAGHSKAGLGAAALMWIGSVVLSFYPRHDSQYEVFRYQRDTEIPRWSAAGRALHRAFPRETSLAAVPIGAVSYYSDLRVIDMMGLTDKTIARTPVPALGSGWAGHEKQNGPYVLSRAPEMLLLGNVFVWEYAFPPALPYLSAVAPAIYARERDVVTDPRFRILYAPAVLRTEGGMFLHYYVRRDTLAPPRPAALAR